MTPEEKALLEARQAGFDDFCKPLIPSLVEFVRVMGVEPAHEVLNSAVHFAPYLGRALQEMPVESPEDRAWLLLRLAGYMGEYFVQKYGGAWYVNDIAGSRYFARYVVGRFARLGNANAMLDPVLMAQEFVDTPVPRNLEALLLKVNAELLEEGGAAAMIEPVVLRSADVGPAGRRSDR